MEIHKLYLNRKLAKGYPNLDKLAVETFTATQEQTVDNSSTLEGYLRCFSRLVELSEYKNVLVLGCGPKPQTVKFLMSKGYNAVGVEPVSSFACSARDFLGSQENIVEGVAENIPLPSNSQNIIFCESVLEHVESPMQSLNEMFRVLAPGGIAYIVTSNRYRFSLKGYNGEFNIKFFNWFPDILKESFVFHHLHYNPSLANYSLRPAVHWYSYADLCQLGRYAGFAQFYSPLDLLDLDDPAIAKSKARRFLLNKLKFNPWLRALALRQIGGTIIMLKRG